MSEDAPLFGDFDGFGKCDDTLEPPDIEQKVKSRCAKTASKRTISRRASSEEAYYNTVNWHFEEGNTYNVISQGDIDFLTFARAIVKQQKLDYMILSTWCLAIADAEEIEKWVNDGNVKRIDFYGGEILTKQYPEAYELILKVTKSTGGRLAVFRNHSKVMVGYGEKYACAISSSANINTNPRCEQTVIQINKDVADFYKGFYDGINAFNTDDQPERWEPWQN